MSGRIKGWLHILDRGEAATRTAADIALRESISADVTLAQATQAAANNHDNVQRNVGRVHAQLERSRLEHTRLMGEEQGLKDKVAFLVSKYQQQVAAGDPAAAQTRAQGAAFATALSSKQDELHANEALTASLETAVAQADSAAAASEQQLQDAQQEAERLKSLKVQASLAKAVTESISALTTPQVDGVTATLADARQKIEGDYADAIGMQAVVEHSGAAQAISLGVEMHQAAGASLFDQALAAATPAPAESKAVV